MSQKEFYSQFLFYLGCRYASSNEKTQREKGLKMMEDCRMPWSMRLFTDTVELGKGSYGRVYKATCSRVGVPSQVGLKVLKPGLLRAEQCLREVEIMATLRGSIHVIQLFGAFFHHNPIMVLELAYGTLMEMQLTTEIVVRYTEHLLLGLDFMHQRGILHVDISPSNILIGMDNVAKLADFGNAQRTQHGDYVILPRVYSTLEFAHPRTLEDEHRSFVSKQTDTFMLGATLFLAFTKISLIRPEGKWWRKRTSVAFYRDIHKNGCFIGNPICDADGNMTSDPPRRIPISKKFTKVVLKSQIEKKEVVLDLLKYMTQISGRLEDIPTTSTLLACPPLTNLKAHFNIPTKQYSLPSKREHVAVPQKLSKISYFETSKQADDFALYFYSEFVEQPTPISMPPRVEFHVPMFGKPGQHLTVRADFTTSRTTSTATATTTTQSALMAGERQDPDNEFAGGLYGIQREIQIPRVRPRVKGVSKKPITRIIDSDERYRCRRVGCESKFARNVGYPNLSSLSRHDMSCHGLGTKPAKTCQYCNRTCKGRKDNLANHELVCILNPNRLANAKIKRKNKK